jgi:hypothetical protein
MRYAGNDHAFEGRAVHYYYCETAKMRLRAPSHENLSRRRPEAWVTARAGGFALSELHHYRGRDLLPWLYPSQSCLAETLLSALLDQSSMKPKSLEAASATPYPQQPRERLLP